MKRQLLAGVLAMSVCIGMNGLLPACVFADTAVIEEDMGDTGQEETGWKLQQQVSAASCKQGKDVTLTVSLTGEEQALKLSTIYVKLKYDPRVFRIRKEDITPMKPEQADYILFDKDLGEIDIYYAKDFSAGNGTRLLKIKLHVLADAETGVTKLGVKKLELYATDSDDYAIIENKSTVKVTIKKADTAALHGDVNQDKKISLADVKLVMEYCNGGIELTETQKKNADVNKDGKINLTDAKLIMKYCNGEMKKL